VLIDAGADPNARTTGGGSKTPGPGSETPLHYAASSDDVDVAAAVIDGGADLETPDGSIGTPLDNAVGYACWHVARLLVMRGARVDKLWHAGAPWHARSIAGIAHIRGGPRAGIAGILARLRRRSTPCSPAPAERGR
jgi:hypothetical protein